MPVCALSLRCVVILDPDKIANTVKLRIYSSFCALLNVYSHTFKDMVHKTYVFTLLEFPSWPRWVLFSPGNDENCGSGRAPKV